ncbi:kinesin KIF3B [Solea senegalensis]|uniref:Kinesin-like protein n=1 Tax=Solea senegalensis TaxID=28829 RepID=A0AAV6R176_SOLSE|nr:kinesin-like protein KIF3B [Solea senegalensis]KAG7499056.1 kinesin KIF3B [Solea senegalensis]
MSKNKNSESVKVVVRCRPMNEKERTAKFEGVVSVNVKLGQIIVRDPKKASDSELPKVFTFDSVYDWNSNQMGLYNETIRPLVDSVLLGFNGTIFAYGQTGTGKTYTMEGVRNDPERRGVIPNSFDHIFTHISHSQNEQYLVRVSYLEIYQEEIRDLLAKDQSQRLQLRERPDTGVYVEGLSSCVTKSVSEIKHVMYVGSKNRSVGATNMNEHSSRSHAIFVITVECSELDADGKNHIRVGKLNLVDLAGSERQTKTGAERERLKEATKINLSLSALGNVISALVDGRSSHIPYRDSKLTRLLQDSLGGNAYTVMVANIGPASYNLEETLTTLRYSYRAKSIKNKPCINIDPKDNMLRQFQEEIAKLKEQLQERTVKNKKRRQKRGGGEGDNGEGGGEIDYDEEDGNNEDYWQEEQDKLEKERRAIMADHSLVAEEKVQLLKEKEKKMEDFKIEKEALAMLAAKIKAMQSKLLVGGKTIVDHTNEQQKMLEQKRQEIYEQKQREQRMQKWMESCDNDTLELKETYISLQQEVDIKTKKLKKLFAKLQAVKAENDDIREAHIEQRQELEETQDKLTRNLKLKHLIIENFIPLHEKNKIVKRVYFDEEDGHWKTKLIPHLENRHQMSMIMKPRMRKKKGKKENILILDIDPPTQYTKEYQEPIVAPKLAAALRDILRDEDEIQIDASGFNSCLEPIPPTGAQRKKTKDGRPKTGKKSRSPISPIYPQPRGLVPK